MSCVLVLVDVQNEFAGDSRIVPPASLILPAISHLLDGFRSRSFPVVHIHYITEASGEGYLPHHRAQGRPRCLRGSSAAQPVPEAKPTPGEPVFAKHAYSAFDSDEFDEFLSELHADSLVLCGLYSHACVRQTALDAHLRGYRVQIAADAIASFDPLHAEVTRDYLSGRGIEYIGSQELVRRHDAGPIRDFKAETLHADDDGGVVVHERVASANRVQPAWAERSVNERLAVVEKWGHLLQANHEGLINSIIEEVGKPLQACRIEMRLLEESLRVLREVVSREPAERVCVENRIEQATARRRPVGTVAVIAPWNNPVFLPAIKIASATVMGNAVVWKPSPACPLTSMALQDTLQSAGFPDGLIQLIPGGKDVARKLVADSGVSAVTLTGSISTGRQVAAACGTLLKPLQAELGGNNATVVLEPCDLALAAKEIVRSAFTYAGQACTACRRVIVTRSIKDDFIRLLSDAARELVVGDPQDEKTDLGPVVSHSQKEHIKHQLSKAGPGARIHVIPLPEGLPDSKQWMPMRIIEGLAEDSPLVQEESFAPVLVVQEAGGLEDAIRLCNGVPQGLVSSLYCEDPVAVAHFQDRVQAGVVQLNLPTRHLHMESPFGGWKASGLGPPEHGTWDLDFYTRWQAVNRKLAD